MESVIKRESVAVKWLVANLALTGLVSMLIVARIVFSSKALLIDPSGIRVGDFIELSQFDEAEKSSRKVK